MSEIYKLLPHVDQECDGVTHMNGASNSVSTEAVARPDLHEALGRREGEDHGVSGVGSEQGTGRVIEGYWGVIRISNYTEGHRGECLGKVVSKSVIQKTVL